MKLVTLENVQKAAPADLFLVLSTGRPYIYQDCGTYHSDAPMALPCIPGAFQLTHTDLLVLASEPLKYPDYPGRVQSSDMTYLQFQDVVKAMGFYPETIPLEKLKVIFQIVPIVQYALYNWTDTLYKLQKHPGSMPYKPDANVNDMLEFGFATLGWSGKGPHIMLTPLGYRLAIAICAISCDLLSGAIPEQYVSADFKMIKYDRLWTERQGSVKQIIADVVMRLDKYIGDL